MFIIFFLNKLKKYEGKAKAQQMKMKFNDVTNPNQLAIKRIIYGQTNCILIGTQKCEKKTLREVTCRMHENTCQCSILWLNKLREQRTEIKTCFYFHRKKTKPFSQFLIPKISIIHFKKFSVSELSISIALRMALIAYECYCTL